MTGRDKILQLPFYAKASLILIGLYVLISMLYIGRSIIVPLVFAVIIAIVLHPVINFFTRMGIKRVIAIIITIFLSFLVIAAFGGLIMLQASKFSQSWPIMVDRISDMINEAISALSVYADISPGEVNAYIEQGKEEMLNLGKAAIGDTIVTIGSTIMVLLLVPVYVFIILFYHSLLVDFLHQVFGKSDQAQVSTIISKTKSVVQRYLVGLIIEAVIIAVMNSVALLALGIEYAILLGIIGALLNVIPYVGGLVAVALPMIVALATETSDMYAVYVLVLYYIIQLIDNNYIVPIIVSSKVKINALFSIIVVFAGNALWGIPGMFLSIPLLAIVKLIFDHIEPLKPWGFLFGDTMPSFLKLNPIFKKK
ncbi:AI-2E family transporter [Sunxiuqinia sp. sy24]|uniref:AI-2E family transporter n=1 Tax=Sunxiuqinia sp. sy24 TaxID=3461495 RepID=UPI0040467BF6